MKRFLISLLIALLPIQAFGQATVLQGGSWTAGLPSFYSISGGPQPIIQQSAPAEGGAQSIKEMSLIARGVGTAPFSGSGTGLLGSIFCMYDAPKTNATGGHQLCLSPNASGGFGTLTFNAFGSASPIPFKMDINGTTLEFPFITSGVIGPGSSVVGHIATWANTSGTLLADGGAALTVGGSSGQVQYNNAGALGGFTVGGDGTLNTGTGALTITKLNGQTVTLGGSLTTAGSLTTTGGNLTLALGGATSVTLPTTGTLATLAGGEALTNKSINGMTITPSTGAFTLTNGKTLAVSNTLTLAGTDASTLNIGAGGTLGTAAFTSSSAYVPSNTQITNSLVGTVAMNNTGLYFDGPAVAQGATGTWFVSGNATFSAPGNDIVNCKLWDGTTVIDSARTISTGTVSSGTIHLSGILANPAGNLRISCQDITSTSSANIVSNVTGNSKDSTISAFRVN